MSATFLSIALGLAILATALVAGVFLAFSDFVMRSFGRVPPEAGSEVMQVLNREVYRSIFIALLIGMSLYSVVLVAYALLRLEGPAAAWIAAGGACYLVGTFGVTMICNVPMNRRLDAMDHAAPATHAYWALYLKNWTFWNTVRTIAPMLSTISFLIGFHHLARQIGAAAIGA